MLLKEMKIVKVNKTLAQGLLFSIYAFIGRGIGFVLLVLLANYIPPSDYGKLSLFNTVLMLVGFLMTFSTYGYFGNSYIKESRTVFRKDFSGIIIFLLLSAIFVAAIFLLFGNSIHKIIGLDVEYLWWALIVGVFNILFQLHIDYYRLNERIKLYGVLNLSNASLNAILSLLFVAVFLQGWKGRVYVQILVTIIYGFVGLYYFISNGFFDFRVSLKRMKYIFLWGLPQIPHMATNWIRQGCDQYIINYNYSTYEVGLFSFALNLVSIITMIGMAFNSSNAVTIYKILADRTLKGKIKILSKNTRYIFYIYSVSTLATIVLAFIFVPVFLPKYDEALCYFLLLSIYGFLVCMYFLYCNYLFYYDHTRQLMYITFGTSVLHLGLSLILTHISLYFTAFLYILSQFLCVALVYRISKRIVMKEIGRDPF